MKNKLIKTVIIGSLAICSLSAIAGLPFITNPIQMKGSDGYYFTRKPYTQTDMQIQFVTYQNNRDFNAQYFLLTGHNTRGVVAFTRINGAHTSCTIYTIDPLLKYSPEFYGHELMHCFYGQWHRDNSSDGS